MTNTPTLLPCPFKCEQSKLITGHQPDSTRQHVVCVNCGAAGPWADTFEEARELWNTRTSSIAGVPAHRCNGVNGAERHGTQNRCTICGEYREGWYDATGMEIRSPTVPAQRAAQRLRSKLDAETKINDRLHRKGDGSVDALTHYSDGRRDALISAIEIVEEEYSRGIGEQAEQEQG